MWKNVKRYWNSLDVAFSSLLTRSIQTLNYILGEMDLHYIPVFKTWRLNEKHYGSLTVKLILTLRVKVK